jgi:hypothetical protein
MGEDDRRDLVARMFALLTGKFEDGAAIAADGQGRDIANAIRSGLAERLRAIGGEIAILAEAATLLCDREPG